ncbi:glycosyltransferase family 39 protein [Myxococcus sp. Y35]|uniref:glycosyltransferase family 39 protein n=1 Tax=Pseudomyxococcus flavus TaxID=3115648 RepID=UPI003CFA7023
MKRPGAWLLGILLVAVILGFQTRSQGPNLYSLQAEAWLGGRLDVAPGPHDLALYDGRAWVPFPPFPSVLLLPVVAATGAERAPVVMVSGLLSLLAGWATWRLLTRLDVALPERAWLSAALLLGTGFWSCVLWSNGVWFFAHVVAATFLLLAVSEALGRGRAVWVGLLAGCAFLSRQLVVYSLVFLLAVLWRRASAHGRKRQVVQVVLALGGFGLCALVYLAYNAARFGGPFDTGYAYIPLDDFLAARVAKYGLFHPAYVPFNFVSMFLEGPHFVFSPPRLLQPVAVDGVGTSLTIASPFVFVALAARGDGTSVPVRAAWASVLLALTHMLLYYNNGYVQLNAHRFCLDFFPVLFVLVALGANRLPADRWKPLVAWAVGLNVFVLAVLPGLSRALRRL